ncbi:NADP-dependent oxidoreductase [Rhodoligotrophos ferricapiens]|uniref:NADP-dependent oxidoreductase n=1 Tax=Rhodoligotrophos ferricapiens TaxID=3069264 RepID=UPI00315DB731
MLTQVKAAGVNGIDFKVRQGFVRDAFPLSLPVILGSEMAGTVVEVGPEVEGFEPGDRVMGWLAGFGAFADYVAVDAVKLARTPDGLRDVQAGAIPLAALAAWHLIHTVGDVRAGQTVLIHGASGNVGTFAVQFAKAAGARVLAVTANTGIAAVAALGADRVIDRQKERFEEVARGVDLAVDVVGGEVLHRTWAVMAPGGLVLSTVTPEVANAPDGLRGQFSMTQLDTPHLQAVADQVAAGTLKFSVGEVVSLAELAHAIDRNWNGRAQGKMVVDFNR